MAQRRDLAAIAAIVLVTALLFWPALTGQLFELRDFPRWTLPSRELWREAILTGRIPQWNPTVGLGVPTLAIPVHGTFYPGQLLLLVVPLGVMWTLHAALGGAGGYLLARALRCRPAAALIAGLTLAVGGYAVSMWANGEKVISGAWVPWVALFLMQRRPVAAAIALAMIALAGDPFLWAHALLLAAATSERAWRETAVAIGLGLLLSALALVPAIALVSDSERMANTEALIWSMHPIRLLELIDPGALGDPNGVYPGARYVGEKIGPTPWAISMYAGAAVGLFAPWGRRRALWIVAGIAVVFALGRYVPYAPRVPLMRYPEKHAYLLTAALAVLASLGCERALAGEVPLKWLPLPMLALSPLMFLAPVQHPQAIAIALVLTGLLFVKRPQWTPLIVALDLLIAALPLVRWTRLEQPAWVATIKSYPVPYPPRLYRPREAGASLDTLPENLGELWGIAHVPGHDAALPARFHQLWDRLSGEEAVRLLAIDWTLLPTSQGLRLMRWTPARVTPGCAFERYQAESIALGCELATPTRVVLAEGYSPGWTATVDGAPATLHRVHEVLRGVDLPAGRHRVEMRYRTPGLIPGALATLLGIVAAVWLRLRSRGVTSQPGREVRPDASRCSSDRCLPE